MGGEDKHICMLLVPPVLVFDLEVVALQVIELFPAVGTSDISADLQLPCQQDCLLGSSTLSQQFCSHQGCGPPWAGC